MPRSHSASATCSNSIGENIKANPLRAEYEAKVAGLSDHENTLRSQGLEDRDIAQSMHQARRDLGVE